MQGEVSKSKVRFNVLIFVVLLAMFASVGCVSAKTWYVDDDGGADFTRIQDAISAASAGDTIIVRDGTYVENVNVDKSLTIRSENGSANCIVQAKDSNDPVFEVTADYVEINGFNVKGEEVGKLAIIKKEGGIAGIKYVYFSARRVCGGIDLDVADFCNISNNNISLGVIGISLSKSSNNNLINNAISNLSFGIYLVNSSNNTLTNHRISHTNEGIFISSGNSNSLTNNNASSNSYDGILLLLVSNNNIITNNTVANNNCSGIYLGFSNNNTIYLNNFINNTDNVESLSLIDQPTHGTQQKK
uniref:Periplasmic copper-binding protein NosD beta helix domain-containing protein n=1 Tax=Candidatus Methanophaga sp. ANME-1 ERB7 TaxID=2759913 RepID=A0A7G9ZAR8_9EURY|nr:hypothetical protein DPOOOCMC_00010 [Methanosarcinales archaeon ANME-1 ERB7]